MLLLLLSQIGFFLSGGGNYSPSGSYSISLGVGPSFPFDEKTYGYLEVETMIYSSLELLDYTPRRNNSEVSHSSTKLIFGPSVEFQISRFIVKPGVYYIMLSQRIKDKYYIDGSYIITEFFTQQSKGYGINLSLLYPIHNRYRIGFLWKREWNTAPINELGLHFRIIL
jgi:hypothetical protein